MSGGEGIDIPSLPIGQAADQILNGDHVLGGVAIFQTVAIIFLVWWIIGVYRELRDARNAHIEDLKLNIPAMQELRETIISTITRRRT